MRWKIVEVKIMSQDCRCKAIHSTDCTLLPFHSPPCLKILLLRHGRSEEHTSELQSRLHLVCRLLLEKKNRITFGLSARRPPAAALTPPSHCDTVSLTGRQPVWATHTTEPVYCLRRPRVTRLSLNADT